MINLIYICFFHSVRRNAKKRVFNQRGQEIVDTDTIMKPNLGPVSRTANQPNERALGKCNEYVLDHQSQAGHQLFRGEVNPSITGKGISVVLDGVETLTTASLGANPRTPRKMTPIRRMSLSLSVLFVLFSFFVSIFLSLSL